MTLQETVLKAIEGGYKGGKIWGREGDVYILRNEHGDRYGTLTEEQILLDPLFWQSLGKALGWRVGSMEGMEKISPEVVRTHFSRMVSSEWRWNWHRFVNVLADGKTGGSFFEDL